MLKNIYINNFITINEININLNHGLTVISGETGAGKSIILESIKILLGYKFNYDLIKDIKKLCILSVKFELKNVKLHNEDLKKIISNDNILNIRREFNALNKKGYCYLNNYKVNLSLLRRISGQIIKIYYQGNSYEILDYKNHIKIIDDYSDINNFDEYNLLYKDYIKVKKQIKDYNSKYNIICTDIEYNKFVLNELNEANLNECEFKDIELYIDRYNNKEYILNSLNKLYNLFNGYSNKQYGILNYINNIYNILYKLNNIDNSYNKLLNRIEILQIDIKDVFLEIEKNIENLNFDENYEHKLSRYSQLNDLILKYKKLNLKDLIIFKEDLNNKINLIEYYHSKLNNLKLKIKNIYNKIDNLSNIISKKRNKCIKNIIFDIKNILSKIGMENSTIYFEISKLDDINENGKDKIVLKFSANKCGKIKKINKNNISGGEATRISLAIDYIIAKKKKLPVIILDEIDTGISGNISNKVGNLIKDISKTTQVLVITHSPQIACKADNHIKIYKKNHKLNTYTDIKYLSYKDKIKEIAQMISSGKITKLALMQAEDMINMNKNDK